jgi:hypothetical protein
MNSHRSRHSFLRAAPRIGESHHRLEKVGQFLALAFNFVRLGQGGWELDLPEQGTFRLQSHNGSAGGLEARGREAARLLLHLPEWRGHHLWFSSSGQSQSNYGPYQALLAVLSR